MEPGFFQHSTSTRSGAPADIRQQRVRPSSPGFRRAGCWLIATALLCALTGCGHRTPAAKAAAYNFPVVEPFAIDRAGSKLTVEFELPNALEGTRAPEGTRLRPVFVGFRAVNTPSKTDAEFKVKQGLMRYLDRQPIPVRLKVWRLEGGQRIPVVLQELHRDVPGDRSYYLPQQGDVLTLHYPTSTDGDQLIAAGHYDFSKSYFDHQFARIAPPTPGRYVLEVESLETHPVLHGMPYELLVSHYYHRGID